MMPRPSTGALVGGTTVAIFVAFITLAVVSVVVGVLFSLFYSVTTVLRPGIVGFMGAIVGGAAGTYAARGACDAILRHYSGRAVFITVLVLAICGIVFEVGLGLTTDRIAPLAQIATITYLAWKLFWKGEPI